MLRIVGVRALALLPILLSIAVITFVAIRLIPGDAITIRLGESYSPDAAAQLQAELYLDRPVPEQFARWFGGLLRGDLGPSIRTGRPVTEEIFGRLPATLQLGGSAIALSLVFAIPAGVFAARRRQTPWDFATRIVAFVGVSVPNFLVGILLILVFAVSLGALPAGGYRAPSEGILAHARTLMLPSLTLAVGIGASTMRMMRSTLLEVLDQNYIRTARSKGLSENKVIYRHGVPNALIPVVTVVGVQLGTLLGGAIVVEQVFSWPGLGSLVIQAIYLRDYPLLQGAVMLLASVFVVANLIVDVLYAWLNPRLRDG
jgi:peptide/nickel transport system permease protein